MDNGSEYNLTAVGRTRLRSNDGQPQFHQFGNGLQMSLARNRTSANRLKIILDEDTDTYTMYFTVRH